MNNKRNYPWAESFREKFERYEHSKYFPANYTYNDEEIALALQRYYEGYCVLSSGEIDSDVEAEHIAETLKVISKRATE